MENEKKIALLIDAENVSQKYIKYILDELATYGISTYKRIYGDWTQPNLSSWKEQLLECSITPVQQYSYTKGKNSTDSALIIDAMDILYSKNVDGFCIVSSDSDFTRLAARLREAGMFVIGMGEEKTPRPFITACERFKYLESLCPMEEQEPHNEGKKKRNNSKEIQKLIKTIRSIVNEVSDEEGWAYLGDVGNVLNKRLPDFDTRNYGFHKLMPLVQSLKVFEVRSFQREGMEFQKFIRNKQGGKK